ncbi:hypothetical protein F0562_033506 [Nyssa sinensis]|uniref:Nudix hydrolase domain-containing protein n=1 Tax=Nyssa sinensis TaxID=561372 RepID=A0A5J5AGY5_9ASTE|nr:hypothetical protein F0562_033506 [Nyssa sinensis]
MVSMISRTGRHLQRYNKGQRLVVGCIPYKYKKGNDGTTNNELEVLVISSQKGQGMMFPKGGWELDESVEEAASRESLEEAGCELGRWCFKSKSCGTYHEGRMFPLLVTEQLELWPEKNVRRRIWMSVAEAKEVCQQMWMKEALDKLVDRIKSSPQQKEEDVPPSLS